MHPQPRPSTRQLFLDARAIFSPEWPLKFFVSTNHQVIWPSPGTLIEGTWQSRGARQAEGLEYTTDYSPQGIRKNRVCKVSQAHSAVDRSQFQSPVARGRVKGAAPSAGDFLTDAHTERLSTVVLKPTQEETTGWFRDHSPRRAPRAFHRAAG